MTIRPLRPASPMPRGLRAKGTSVAVVVYPNAYHGFDGVVRPRFDARRTTVRNCHGVIDLDTSTFTMQKGSQTASGEAAAAELKDCTEHGVTLGGDPEAREKAPLDVAAFLKSTFGIAK